MNKVEIESPVARGVKNLRQTKIRPLRYRIYLLGHGAVVLTVLALFASIHEKQLAAVFAGGLFILSPLLVLTNEIRQQKLILALKSFSVWGCLQFLILSALPVFLLRVTNWGVPFDQLSMLGVAGPDWHRFSNISFLLMLLGFAVDGIRARRA